MKPTVFKTDEEVTKEEAEAHQLATSNYTGKHGFSTQKEKRNVMAHRQTRSEMVKEFTEQSMGKDLPTHPRVMTRAEIDFIVRMNLEELQELLATVANDGESTLDMLIDTARRSRLPKAKNFKNEDGTPNTTKIIAEQVDAFVDIDYYNNNAAAKVGTDPDQIFKMVHGANMAKKFPDGTFHKDEHGKVIKPPDWHEAPIEEVVEEWECEGTWH